MKDFTPHGNARRVGPLGPVPNPVRDEWEATQYMINYKWNNIYKEDITYE